MKIASSKRALFIAPLLLAITALAFALACAPAADDAGMSTDRMEVDQTNVSLKIGEQTPPFAMVLADGTEVSSADLADESQPAHLFWFATW